MKKNLTRLLLLVGILSAMEVGAFQPFTIKSIRISGLQRVSEGAVLNDLPFNVGDNVSEAKASEAIQALYKTGFFKEVTLAREGSTLVIQVVERPTISKLTLSGIKDKDKVSKILREAGLAEGRLYDPTIVAKAQRELERFYFTKGKYGVRIEPKIEECGSLINIIFDIYEGDVARIKQIKIVGNTVFCEDELIKPFHSCTTNWLSWFKSDDLYAKEKLQADLETLRSYYMDRGYIHFQVDSTQVSLSPDKKHIYITVHVTEGEKYTVGETQLAGRFIVPECDLVKILNALKCGDTFSRKALFDVKQGLEERLGHDGYSFAEARAIHEIDEVNKQINVTFEIVPGRKMYVRRILFKGNQTTKDEVLRRELPQMEGTWISTDLVKAGKEKILRRGFGSAVEIETEVVPGCSDQVDIVYEIEEARLGQVGAGLGYSPTEGIMFNFSISQENFFGTGKGVDFTFDKSKAQKSYAIGYQDPYFTVDGIGMGFSAYYNQSNLSKTTFQSAYTTDNYGGEIRWVLPMSQYDAIRFSLGYDNTRLKISNDLRFVAPEIIAFTKKYGKDFKEGVAGVGWSYDSRDQPLFPRKGLSQSLALRVVIPGAKLQYYRATYDLSWFKPISDNERWIVNLISCLGYGNGFGKSKQLPFYRHFFAGGTRFVRGFEENSLGPKDSSPEHRAFGGNALIAGTAALIFPNPIKPDAQSIRTALFLDAGQVYDTHSRKQTLVNGQRRNSGGIRYSVGVSLTWHSPLGAPISFALAKPLNAKNGDEKRLFTFWMGTQF